MLFNPDKYQLLVYSCNGDKFEGLYYNNVYIVATEYGIHLGHPVGPKGAPKQLLMG